ncbi:ABC transporter permease, partial [bacterium]|nr:ABC transporter permease [bacterium]
MSVFFKQKLAFIGFITVVLLLIVVIIGPWICPHSFKDQTLE